MMLRARVGAALVFLTVSAGVPAQGQDQDQDQAASAEAAAGQGASYPKGSYHALDALPDWGGIWFMERSPGAGDDTGPQLKGVYLAQEQEWQAEVRANDGVERRDRSNCSPPGMPRIMQLAQYPYEFLFTPGRVTINQEAWMQTRTIWTDGREHPEDPDPTFHGHSIGHWEGDTLVVETIGIDAGLMFTRTGAFHSPEFTVEERIRLSPDDPEVLVNAMRFTDPLALEEAYSVTVQYRRDRENDLIEFQCAENDRNPVNQHGETEYN